MRKALAIAKTFVLFGIRQFFVGTPIRRILYTKYEFLAIITTNTVSILTALILSYTYGEDLFINPWKSNIFIDLILAFFLVFTSIIFIFTPAKGLSLPPGYEFLLYQPVKHDEIITGITLGITLQSITIFMLMASIPLVISFFFNTTLGSIPPSLRVIVSFILLLVYVMVYYMPFTLVLDVVRTILLKKRRDFYFLSIQIIAFVYIFIGISHSIILSIDSGFPTISSILTIPIKLPYIIAFEISKFIGFIGYIFGIIAAFSTFYVLIRYVNPFLSVEDFISIRDVYEERLAKQIENELKRKPLISWVSPEEVLKQVLIDLSPLNPRNNVKRYTLAFLVVISIAFILRVVFMKIHYITIENLGAFSGFIIGVGIMFMHIPLINELLFNDLRSLWILKIYSCNDLPFVKILNIKYLSYLGITLAILSLFSSIVLRNLHLLFLPILILPITCLSINLVIVLGVKYLRKHRGKPLIYFSSTSGTQLDIYASILMLPVAPSMIGLSLFTSLIANRILVDIGFMLTLIASILVFILLNLLLIKWVGRWITEVELY
ncbi:MAG: hypothetical protein QXZ41_03240 [Ignisphaera sp.]